MRFDNAYVDLNDFYLEEKNRIGKRTGLDFLIMNYQYTGKWDMD
jgi:hypothetical protein